MARLEDDDPIGPGEVALVELVCGPVGGSGGADLQAGGATVEPLGGDAAGLVQRADKEGVHRKPQTMTQLASVPRR